MKRKGQLEVRPVLVETRSVKEFALMVVRMKSSILDHWLRAAVFSAIVAISLLAGCASKGSKQMQVLKAGDKFYGAYLNGDVDTALQWKH